MSDLNIIPFTLQGNDVPISISHSVPNIPSMIINNHLHTTYPAADFNNSSSPIHEVAAGYNDSIYMMSHSIHPDPISIQIFQQNGGDIPIAFKCITVSKAGSHQNIIFNGHTMFPSQKIYVVLDSVNQDLKDKVFISGYVKRFEI